MRQTLTVRQLTDDERQLLRAGLRSHKAFTLRRCQILLAIAEGENPARIARILGCRKVTVRHVVNDFSLRGVACVREEKQRLGALPRGCPRVEQRQPGILDALEQLIADETAGDPMCEKKWVRVTQARLSQQLAERGYQATDKTVARLLKDMGFSLKANRRRQIKSRCPERDEQFKYIALQKRSFLSRGLPVISVDTKKKELIGPFRNNGRVYCREAEEVDEHDFPSAAECRAVPFGVYDLARNAGYMTVGVSNNTPQFAVKAISRWWREDGGPGYPGALELLILADCGGANGSTSKAWKVNLQRELCDGMCLTVTVCHYPTGCSKWNPIERRLFSLISTNWAGKPLKSLSIMLGYIRGTTTRTGLSVRACLDENTYLKGQKVSREDMSGLDLRRHDVCPKWNYTLRPRNRPAIG
jgi:transposase